jgi:hypothetical protein
MSDETKDTAPKAVFDVFNVFSEEATSAGLGVGIHERIRLISIDNGKRKDGNNNVINKQLYLKFKQFNKAGDDIGEKEISFFVTDAIKDSAVGNLFSFIAQTREILSLFCTEDEITEGFDPIGVLYDAEGETRKEAKIIEDFKYDVIKKKVLKKSAQFKSVEQAVGEQFKGLLETKIGFKSQMFRLKLEESQDAKYIQIPRFDRFVEKASVKKDDSMLYINSGK